MTARTTLMRRAARSSPRLSLRASNRRGPTPPSDGTQARSRCRACVRRSTLRSRTTIGRSSAPAPATTGRGVTNADVGTTLQDPNIDYATVARGFGVHGEGPVSDPAELAPALKRALAVVRAGQPALVDVVTEPR